MLAPVIVDMSALSGPWPGFTVSGFTSTSAPNNGTYVLLGNLHEGGRQWGKVGSGDACQLTAEGIWRFDTDFPVEQTEAGESYDFPYLVPTWNGTGTPVFTPFLPPPVIDPTISGGTPVQATATVVSTGANNDIVLTAVPPGLLGNMIRCRLINPGTNNAALSVSVSGFDITVSVATNGSGVITSTANQVIAAITASVAASELVTAANAVGNNGTAVVTAGDWFECDDGAGGLPLPPVTVTEPGTGAAVAATLTTTVPTANANLVYTAKVAGRIGNGISIEYRHPGAPNRPLTVEVEDGLHIVVRPATDGAAGPNSTASQIKAAIEAYPEAAALVSIANAPGNNGSGNAGTMPQFFLTGGAGGMGPPPVIIPQ